jgi:hypothetical protein
LYALLVGDGDLTDAICCSELQLKHAKLPLSAAAVMRFDTLASYLFEQPRLDRGFFIRAADYDNHVPTMECARVVRQLAWRQGTRLITLDKSVWYPV